MRPIKFSRKDIIELFYHEKVLTKVQLLKISGCSPMTVWRILSKHGYISSYNFNAWYYTLTDIPMFDKNGLWSYQKVCFSRYGSITKTVMGLVCNSKSGMNPNELQELLGVDVRPILTKLYRQGKLCREKVNGIFVYLQLSEQGWQRQLSERRSEAQKKTRLRLPEPERIIAVLVELIQRVEWEPRQLARRLSRQGIKINAAEIQAIFLHYQLKKKPN